MVKLKQLQSHRRAMPTIADNINAVRQRVQQAALDSGRNPEDILILAVSKTKPVSAVQQAIACGVADFGENYLQDAMEKIVTLPDDTLRWHFIGPLQSNKTRAVAEHFQWVHSVDRLKIARRLAEQRPSTLPALNICLQVNIDAEPSKSGFAPQEVIAAALEVIALPGIRLRGLMAIPKETGDSQAQRVPFCALRELFDEINSKLDNRQKLDTLSMGMSGDLEAAIAEGAAIVRVGSDIFGARNQPGNT